MQLKHTNTIVKLQNVSFAYTNEEVIKGVSLDIHKGDYLGIIGPNGGGKSTLLKTILGLVRPQSGSVSLFGVDIGQFKEWYRIGYVPQKTYVEGNFPVTVEEVVAMGRYGRRGLFHFATREDRREVTKALEQVGMLQYKDRQVSALSGGQEQRVFIARALAAEPEIIILDEPTVGVDVETQKQFYGLLRKLNKELALTLVLVSHELDVVAHESTELAYINRTLEYWGDPMTFLKGDYFHELIGRGGLKH